MVGWRRTYDIFDYPYYYDQCLSTDSECTKDSAVNDWVTSIVALAFFCCIFCGCACCSKCRSNN
jgi:hypothetical protein